ncbi:MAG: nucleotidyltransferase domain-containing protein [Leptolyngbyaceae cyanobacterium SL_7_1]|nr:nucleotidyltransferase domain-containing protein [Leptolyngbyaceae cyanobacterium SL_7_1]
MLNRLNVSPEQMQQYILTARSRQQQRLVALEQRRQHGFEIANTAAHLLKTEFSASRVVVFGSLLNQNFHETSDLDLAVWDLPEAFYFQAVSRLLSLSDFAVDLVEVQRPSPEILVAIAQGTEL